MYECFTKHELARMFKCSTRTIQRWIDEGKSIRFNKKEYVPEKDPGGQWRFIVRTEIAMTNTAKR